METLHIISVNQWRIQDFPDGAVNPWIWGKNLSFDKIFPENCIEKKEFGRGVAHT